MLEKIRKNKQGFSWVLYDWANTSCAMIVIALIFPWLFRNYFANTLDIADQSSLFNLVISIASAAIFVLAPLLGNIAQKTGNRKQMMFVSASFAILAVFCLSFVQSGDYIMAAIVYIVATSGYYCANVFYDSMLDIVSDNSNRHILSSLGFSFGYGAGFVILIVVFLWNKLDFKINYIFIFAAIWWAFFSLPYLFFVKEKNLLEQKSNRASLSSVKEVPKETINVFFDILKNPKIALFMLAYQFYVDAINTIIMTGANYATSIGFSSKEIFVTFFIVQVIGISCAAIFGYLAQKIGARFMLGVGAGVYAIVCIVSSQIEPNVYFGFFSPLYIIAGLVGMVQGGMQGVSRSYFMSIIPEEKAVAFYGFYSMIGKSAAMICPAIISFCAYFFKDESSPEFSTRLGIASMSIMFILAVITLMVSGLVFKDRTTWKLK